MKGPVGEVMEAMTVGTAVEISSGMYTRMSQSVHTCVYVSNRVGPEPALLARSLLRPCLGQNATRITHL